ncbi:MAG: DUF3883 domain-containing protein [Pseudomonadota bacterium]
MADNEYLNNILTRLQATIFAFVDDVRRGTHIFEGRRSVEEQLSGEYHGRFLIELIQNADDACGLDGQILIVIRQTPSPRVVVFNTGKGFTSGNFESLCTLGLTDKKPEEAIGNKGLGFRSVLEVCEYPIIFSSNPNHLEGVQPCFDGYCFSFAPDKLRDALNKAAGSFVSRDGLPSIEIAGRSFRLLETAEQEFLNSLKDSLRNPEILRRVVDMLPAYEMPIPTMAEDPLLPWASKKNAVTGVSLVIRPGAEEIFQEALAELDAYTFLFLRNARYISVYLENSDQPYKLIEFKRNIPRPEDKAVIRKGHVKVTYSDKEAWAAICGRKDTNDESQDWWFYRKPIGRPDFETALKDLPKRWHDLRQIDVELAVLIATDNGAGRFAIYLPTKAKTGTGVWVNAPFYGKIDRTGIDWGRDWNACLLGHAVACVDEMVNLLQQSADVESGQAILSLLGIIDRTQKLAEVQISSGLIQRIVKDEAWVLSEPSTAGEHRYQKLSEITSPEAFSWKIKPVEPIPDITCREKIPITFPHPELAGDILKDTAGIFGIATKALEEEDLVMLAEIAVQRIDKNKQTSAWWNDLYRWLGHLDIPYDAVVGKRLVWTQAGILKVQQESRIFSPPRRLVASDEENNPMIRKFQEVLTSSIPAALQDRVAFLHPDIDLGDKLIRSFLIRGYGSETIVREFRTDQVAEFILNKVCGELYREKMSKKRKKDAAEIFAWTFILWRQMRGEGLFVDWSQLLLPTTLGWHPANETYAGKHWTGEEGADLEKVFQNAQPPKPFVVHSNNLIQMSPQIYQDLIREYDLREDLTEFILAALKVWTAPRLLVQKGSRTGGFHPEFCPTGFYNSLDTSTLHEIPEKHKLPIDKRIWEKYLQRIEHDSGNRPFQMPAKYLLKEVACIEDIKIPGTDPEALARCLGRGWNKYYSKYATTTIQRHPQDSGERRQWNVTGFILEQLTNLKWIPMRIWATRVEEGQEKSGEFSSNAAPREVLKVNKDLLETGSALIYSLLPHIAPSVEPEIPEELCRNIGLMSYSPRERDVEEPFHIMQLLCDAHSHLPSGREHFLLSLWQDMFDAAVSRVALGKSLAGKPSAALGFEVQKDGARRLCWLNPPKEGETYIAWVNDNEDSLSMLPLGTSIVCTGKRKTRLDDRVALLKRILDKVDVRRLSELKTIPEFDAVESWETPRILSDTFPWLMQPALAVLAFGRQTSQPMSVSNPKGEFPPLASRIQSARVQYVRNLKIRLEGMDVEPETRSISYSSSDNLLLLDVDADLRLRNLAAPLTLLFGREDYQKPAELWLMKVEESTEDSDLRQDVPLEIAIDELAIEQTSLQELFQVIGGRTQQIIRSVAPALFAISKRGSSPLPAYEINSIISKTADSGNPYDQAEKTMAGILTKSGVPDGMKSSNLLRQIAEQKRDPAEIARTVYGQLGIELGDWNSSAIDISARSQIVSNWEGAEAFDKRKQETRWSACGFLQRHLQGLRKAEFRDRWESYDALKPSDSIHQTWSPTSVQIELSIIEWFRAQAADLAGKVDILDKKPSDVLDLIRKEYIGKDPDTVLNENIKALNLQWKRLRVVLAVLTLRGLDSEAILSQLRAIDLEAPGKWVLQDEKLPSSLSVAAATEGELFVVLAGWIDTQAASVKKLFEGTKADTLDEFIKGKKITPEEEGKAEELLTKGPVIVPKQTIARRSLEVPEKEKPLDDLREKLDVLLEENDQEILDKLAEDVNLEQCANLGDAPAPKHKKKTKGRKGPVPKEKDKEFIGYVGEYLIYRALKKRYPHIGLSEWVSGNKQKFFPGSQDDDSLGYDFCIPVSGHRILIEVKSHTGDQSYFDLGSSELDAAQEALETGDIYLVWVVRNLEGGVDIDHLPNPMHKENRKHFRFEVGRVYYQTG